jgi:hypothetical protein
MSRGHNPLRFVSGNQPIPNGEIVGRRIDRFICAKCGQNSDYGNCGHNCRSLSVMA